MGLTLYWPAYFGAEPWVGSKTASLRPMLPEQPKPEAADHLGAQVGDDVAEQVGGHQHVVVERVLEQPHAHGVDVGVVHRDVRKIFRHLAGFLQEQPVRGPYDVGLVDHRDLLASVLARELEGGRDDPLRAALGVDLAGDGVLVARPAR